MATPQKNPDAKKKKNTVALAVAFVAVAGIGYWAYSDRQQSAYEREFKTFGMPYTEFVERARQGQIYSLTMKGQQVRGETIDNKVFITHVPESADKFMERMIEGGVNVTSLPLDEVKSNGGGFGGGGFMMNADAVDHSGRFADRLHVLDAEKAAEANGRRPGPGQRVWQIQSQNDQA